jgi:hypothetical protein
MVAVCIPGLLCGGCGKSDGDSPAKTPTPKASKPTPEQRKKCAAKRETMVRRWQGYVFRAAEYREQTKRSLVHAETELRDFLKLEPPPDQKAAFDEGVAAQRAYIEALRELVRATDAAANAKDLRAVAAAAKAVTAALQKAHDLHFAPERGGWPAAVKRAKAQFLADRTDESKQRLEQAVATFRKVETAAREWTERPITAANAAAEASAEAEEACKGIE